MPNNPKLFEHSFVREGTKVTITFAEVEVFDHTKRGATEKDKFWRLPVQVYDKRIVGHTEVSNHRVGDIVRALKKPRPGPQEQTSVDLQVLCRVRVDYQSG